MMERLRALLKKYRIELWLVLGGFGVVLGFAITQRILLSTGTSYVQLLGVPLDDVYIHCRYAQNLLHGYGFSFNPGEIVTADTSPLWVLLLSLAGIFTEHLELAAIALSIVFYLAIAPGIYRLCRDLLKLSSRTALFSGWLTVLASRLAWSGMSGMETALAALIMLLIVEEHIRSRQRLLLRPREGVLLGIALLARPEFLFVAAVLFIDWVSLVLKRKADVHAWSTTVLVCAAIASPMLLLPIAANGSIVSHSSIVQGTGVSLLPNFQYLWFAIKILASNNLILFLATVISLGVLWKDRDARLILIVAFGLPILQAFIAPQFRHHGRYFFPVIPLLILLGVIAWNRIQLKMSPRFASIILPLAMLAGAIETGRWAMIESESVRNINDQHLSVVHWLESNVQANDVLAVDDVGAIGYYLNRPVIDLTGLITPSIWPLQHDQDSVWTRARAVGANLFVIYRRLNPCFYDRHKDSLELQRDFPVRLPLASSADTITSIYRIKVSHGS